MKTGKHRNLLDAVTANLYLPLLLAVGGIGIYESIRITNKHHPKNWLAGPSGFMMIVGCLLVVVFAFEVIMKYVRYRNRRAREDKATDNPADKPSDKATDNVDAAMMAAAQADAAQDAADRSAPDAAHDVTADAAKDAGVQAKPQDAEAQVHVRNMYYSAGLLIVYTLLIRWVGFSVSSCLYLLANMLLLKNSVKVTVITVLAVLLYMLVGAPALGMSFPRGLLGI
jgi:hypothetical protein